MPHVSWPSRTVYGVMDEEQERNEDDGGTEGA